MSLANCISAYLAVELDERLAELEGLQGKWRFHTRQPVSSTGHEGYKRKESATRSETSKHLLQSITEVS